MSDALTALDGFLDGVVDIVKRAFRGHKESSRGGVIPQKTLFVRGYPSRSAAPGRYRLVGLEPMGKRLGLDVPYTPSAFDVALSRVLEMQLTPEEIKRIDFQQVFRSLNSLTGWSEKNPVIVDWSGTHPDHVTSDVMVKQLSFLLEQAPMLDAEPIDLRRMKGMVTSYAYVHPVTFSKMTDGKTSIAATGFTTITPSPTKWVVTSLMPKGRIILTPNAMPFLEKVTA